jgi:AraC family transcriptional regulator
MDVRIETLQAVEALSVESIGPYPEKAPVAWKQLWSWVKRNAQDDMVRLAIGYGLDNPKTIPEHMLRYYACVTIAGGHQGEPEAGIEKRMIPGGRYAIYRMKGSYTSMPQRFAQLHDEWLPSSGEVPDYTRPFLENYINDPNEVGLENALTDLCLPIREALLAPQ